MAWEDYSTNKRIAGLKLSIKLRELNFYHKEPKKDTRIRDKEDH